MNPQLFGLSNGNVLMNPQLRHMGFGQCNGIVMNPQLCNVGLGLGPSNGNSLMNQVMNPQLCNIGNNGKFCNSCGTGGWLTNFCGTCGHLL